MQTADLSQQNLTRKLRQQISQWKKIRAFARTRTAGAVTVERRFRRRLRLDQLSA